ncbi:MAG: NPCBM/NEW2 domain-containing protein [Thermoguttaceae bacterium]|nr:NPCBM/NEW2 domain-containing protein [Thermoguttaceae bacterium]
MRKFLFVVLTALTFCVGAAQAAETGRGVKAVTENGVISLYLSGETAPFASLPAETESGDVLEVVPIDGSFVGLRVSPKLGEARTVKSLFIPEITVSASWVDESSKVLGTAGLKTVNENPGSYMFAAAANPETNRGVVAAWLTTDKASGVVFTRLNESGQLVIRAESQYGRWEIPADARAEDFKGEILVVGAFDDCRFGLEAYADQVAKQYSIRLLPQPSGYCTWYSNVHGRAGNENATREFMDAAAEKLVPFGFNLFQIDDGWQMGNSKNGPRKNFTAHDPNGAYASGMKPTAEYIRSKGATAGVWIMASSGNWNDPYYADKQDFFVKAAVDYPPPGEKSTRRYGQTAQKGQPYETFWGGTCFDFTNPAVCEYVENELRQASAGWGYRYFKLDGLWTAMGCMQNYVNDGYEPDDLGEQTFRDMTVPQVATYRKALGLYKKATDNAFILGCTVSQNMRSMGASYGLVDAIRIGPDNGASWDGICRGPVRGSARYFYNGRVWYNDPDPVYVRDSVPLNQSQLIATWASVSGALYLFSDWLPDLSQTRVDVLRRTMAPHRCTNVRPVDLFSSELARFWRLSRGDYAILAIYNWNDRNVLAVDRTLDRLDLDPAAQYVGFDFWNDSFVAPFKGSLICSVPAASCRALSLRKVTGAPVLVSTSRHVCSPLFEVENEAWDAQTKTLSGTSTVVANDAYELRIVAENFKAVRASFDGVEASVTIHQDGPTVRVRVLPARSGKVAWSVRFEADAVPLARPEKPTDFHADAGYTGAALSWTGQSPFGYVLKKTVNGQNPQTIFVSGTSYFDSDARLGETVEYALAAKGWGEIFSEAVSATAVMPEKIVVPPQGPEPELNIADMKPVSLRVGWGTFHPNRDIEGRPFKLDGKPYEKGVGLHANANVVYNVPADKRRFVATAGLSDSQRTDERRSVVIRVWTNVCEMGEPEVCVAKSPILGAKTEVDSWNFDLQIDSRVKQIRLEVTDAEDGNNCDHVDFVRTGFCK